MQSHRVTPAVGLVACLLATAPAAAADPPPDADDIDTYPVAQGRFTTPTDFYWVYFRTPDGRSCGIGPNGGPVGSTGTPRRAGGDETDGRQQLGPGRIPRVRTPRRSLVTSMCSRRVIGWRTGGQLRGRESGHGDVQDLRRTWLHDFHCSRRALVASQLADVVRPVQAVDGAGVRDFGVVVGNGSCRPWPGAAGLKPHRHHAVTRPLDPAVTVGSVHDVVADAPGGRGRGQS